MYCKDTYTDSFRIVYGRQVMLRTCLKVCALGVVISALNCDASVLNFFDLGERISGTIDGNPIASGGRVSNLQFDTESVSFDLSVITGGNFVTQTLFTRLLNPIGSEDQVNTVSDVLVISIVNGAPTYHVHIGSDPQLPTIPEGALDLTTVPQQILPADPYYENGTSQLVGTVFFIAPGGGNDTFFIQSDVGTPEPESVVFLGTGLALCALARRKIRPLRRSL